GSDDGWKISLEPNASAVIIVQLEASRIGRAAADVWFETDALRLHRTVSYRVLSPADEAPMPENRDASSTTDARASISIRRTVLWIDPELTKEAEQLTPFDPANPPKSLRLPDAPHVVLEEGRETKAGNLLLIQDEFELPVAGALTWTQRAPG